MVTSYAAETGKVVLDRLRLGAPGLVRCLARGSRRTNLRASESGTVVVCRAADTLDVLARNDLGESITATAGHCQTQAVRKNCETPVGIRRLTTTPKSPLATQQIRVN